MRFASTLSAALLWIAIPIVVARAEPLLAAPESSICLMMESAAQASDLLAGTGPMPAETRNRVLAITGRPVEDWARESNRRRVHRAACCLKGTS